MFARSADALFSLLLVQLTTERYITLAIAKKGPQEHWPRLLKAAGKPAPNIKVRVHGSCDRVLRWTGLWLECSVERCAWLVQTAWGACYMTSRKGGSVAFHSLFCSVMDCAGGLGQVGGRGRGGGGRRQDGRL